jgi:hypothetical protein
MARIAGDRITPKQAGVGTKRPNRAPFKRTRPPKQNFAPTKKPPAPHTPAATRRTDTHIQAQHRSATRHARPPRATPPQLPGAFTHMLERGQHDRARAYVGRLVQQQQAAQRAAERHAADFARRRSQISLNEPFGNNEVFLPGSTKGRKPSPYELQAHGMTPDRKGTVVTTEQFKHLYKRAQNPHERAISAAAEAHQTAQLIDQAITLAPIPGAGAAAGLVGRGAARIGARLLTAGAREAIGRGAARAAKPLAESRILRAAKKDTGRLRRSKAPGGRETTTGLDKRGIKVGDEIPGTSPEEIAAQNQPLRPPKRGTGHIVFRPPGGGPAVRWALRKPSRAALGYGAVQTPIAAARGGRAPQGPASLATAPLHIGAAVLHHPGTITKNFQESLVGIPAGLMYASQHPARALAWMKADIVHRYGPLWRGDPKTFEKVVAETGLTPFALDALGAGGGISQVIGRLGGTGAFGRTFAHWMTRERPDLHIGKGVTRTQRVAHGVAARGAQHFTDWARAKRFETRGRRPALVPGEGEVVPLTRAGAGAAQVRDVITGKNRKRVQGTRIKRVIDEHFRRAETKFKHIPKQDRQAAVHLAVQLAPNSPEQFAADAQRLAEMTAAERKRDHYQPPSNADQRPVLLRLAQHPEYFTPEFRQGANDLVQLAKSSAALDPGFRAAAAEARAWAPLAQYLGPELRGESWPPEPPAPSDPLGPQPGDGPDNPDEPISPYEQGGGDPQIPPELRDNGEIDPALIQGLTPAERRRLNRARSNRAPGHVARGPEDLFPGLQRTDQAGGPSSASERFGTIDRRAGGIHDPNHPLPPHLADLNFEDGLTPEERLMIGQDNSEAGGSVPPGFHGHDPNAYARERLKELGHTDEEIDQMIEAHDQLWQDISDQLGEQSAAKRAELEDQFKQFAAEYRDIQDLPTTDEPPPPGGGPDAQQARDALDDQMTPEERDAAQFGDYMHDQGVGTNPEGNPDLPPDARIVEQGLIDRLKKLSAEQKQHPPDSEEWHAIEEQIAQVQDQMDMIREAYTVDPAEGEWTDARIRENYMNMAEDDLIQHHGEYPPDDPIIEDVARERGIDLNAGEGPSNVEPPLDHPDDEPRDGGYRPDLTEQELSDHIDELTYRRNLARRDGNAAEVARLDNEIKHAHIEQEYRMQQGPGLSANADGSLSEHPAGPAEPLPGQEHAAELNAGDAKRRGRAEEFFGVDADHEGMPDWYDDEGHITLSGWDEAGFRGETPPEAIINWDKTLKEYSNKAPARALMDLVTKSPHELSRTEEGMLGAIARRSQKEVLNDKWGRPFRLGTRTDLIKAYRAGAVGGPPNEGIFFAKNRSHAEDLAGIGENVREYALDPKKVLLYSKAFPEYWNKKSQLKDPELVLRRKDAHALPDDPVADDTGGAPPDEPPPPDGGGGGDGGVPPLGHGGTPTPDPSPFGPVPPKDLGAVQDIAETQGRAEPGYFPSQMREGLRSGLGLDSKSGAMRGPMTYAGRLFQRGIEDPRMAQLRSGLHANVNRAVSWNHAAETIENHALPAPTRFTDIMTWLEQNRIRPDDVVLVNQALLRKLGGDHELSFGDAVGKATHIAATAPEEFTRDAKLTVLPRAAAEGFTVAPGWYDGQSHVFAFLKTKASRAILGSLNLPWLQFQILSNVAMTGLARTGPMDIAKSMIWWRGLSEADKQWIQPFLGQGHFSWEEDAHPYVFRNASNAFVRAFRQYRELHPGWKKANPLNWMFAADRKQNEIFRRAILYSQVKRQAYRQLGQTQGKLFATQERLDNILQLGPKEQMEAILKNQRLLDDHAKYVDQFLGDYLAFTPKEQKYLASNVMFYAFLRYSMRMVFYTMPVRHPIMTSILGKIGLMGAAQAKAALGDGTLPYQLGAWYYTKDGKDLKVDFSRANPALSALTQNNSVVGRLGSVLPPVLQMATTQAFARTPFKGDVKLNRSTQNVDWQNWGPDASRLKVLARDIATLYYPYRTAEKIAAGGRDISRDSLLIPHGTRYTKYKRPDRILEEQQERAALAGPLANRIAREVLIGVPQPSLERSKNKRRKLGGKRAPTVSPSLDVSGSGGGGGVYQP